MNVLFGKALIYCLQELQKSGVQICRAVSLTFKKVFHVHI